MELFEGLVAAPFAPYDAQGNISYDLIVPYVAHLVKDGLKGLFINGSNGEGPNLTSEERMLIAEKYTAAAGNRIKTIIHLGHSSIAEARKLGAHAEKIGATAISSVAAFYYKPANVTALVDSMAAIASSAPGLPFYYYHIPHLTGVGMDMVEFLKQGREKIPNLQGIKYTAPTIHEYQSCLDYAGNDFEVLYGTDEMLLSALAVGATGAIGSTYSFAAPLFYEVINAFKHKDIDKAREVQSLLVEMIKIFLAYPPIPAQKAIMDMIGIHLGSCRLPLQPLKNGEANELRKKLESIGFFERLSEASGKN